MKHEFTFTTWRCQPVLKAKPSTTMLAGPRQSFLSRHWPWLKEALTVALAAFVFLLLYIVA